MRGESSTLSLRVSIAMDGFAFVSASTDDVLRVMAVGIDDDAVAIRLASNTGYLS